MKMTRSHSVGSLTGNDKTQSPLSRIVRPTELYQPDNQSPETPRQSEGSSHDLYPPLPLPNEEGVVGWTGARNLDHFKKAKNCG